MDENQRKFVHAVVLVWTGVVVILPWLAMAGQWFLAYLVLINFAAATIAVCATRWWMRRRRRTDEA